VGGTFSTHGGFEKLVKNPEGKRSLGRYWRRWEDNVKTNFKVIGYATMD
jgi:hypothetical protein